VNKVITYAVGLAALLSVAVAAPNETGVDRAPTSPLSGWSELRLEGRKLLIAAAEVRMTRHPERDLLRVESLLRIPGPDDRHLAWSRADGGVLRHVELAPEEKVRFVHLERPVCGASDEAGPPRVVSQRHRFGDDGPWQRPKIETVELSDEGRGVRHDPWSLLAHLDELLEVRSLDLATRDGLIRLRVVDEGSERETLRLVDLVTGEEREVALRRATVALSSKGGRTLLGMSGDTILEIDADSGALLEIRGERDGIPGTIRLRLVAFSTAPRAPPAFDPTDPERLARHSVDGDAGIP
jgi:hypothetical protein